MLNDFLPRVGNLLEKQCPKAGHLPWTLTDKRGEKLASGEAAKVHGWKPVVKQEAVEQPETPPQPAIPAAVAVTSPQADTAQAQRFNLPQGCHFRTFWRDDANGGALFIPAGEALRCGGTVGCRAAARSRCNRAAKPSRRHCGSCRAIRWRSSTAAIAR